MMAHVEQGIEELVNQLYHEGIEKAESEAEQILVSARSEAERIRSEAKEEAERLMVRSREAAEAQRQATLHALHSAVRDTVLTIKEQLTIQLEQHLRTMVAEALDDDDYLRRLITLIAQRDPALPPVPVSVLIGDAALGGEDAAAFVRAALGDVAREGMRFGAFHGRGIRVKLEESDIVIDMSEEALGDLVYEVISPRYRELLERVQVHG